MQFVSMARKVSLTQPMAHVCDQANQRENADTYILLYDPAAGEVTNGTGTADVKAQKITMDATKTAALAPYSTATQSMHCNLQLCTIIKIHFLVMLQSLPHSLRAPVQHRLVVKDRECSTAAILRSTQKRQLFPHSHTLFCNSAE